MFINPDFLRGTQIVLVSASVGHTTSKLFDKYFPNAKRINQKSLHQLLPKLKQNFLRLKGRDKIETLIDLLKGEHQTLLKANTRTNSVHLEWALKNAVNKALEQQVEEGEDVQIEVAPTIVFCNTVPSCQAVEHALQQAGFKTTTYHGDVPPIQRTENFAAFYAGDRNILVATDLAARGLDTTFVQHVIIFDFPKNPIDYLHRAGRTARAGESGRVTSLVTKHDERLTRAIEKVGGGGSLNTLMRPQKTVPLVKKRKEKDNFTIRRLKSREKKRKEVLEVQVKEDRSRGRKGSQRKPSKGREGKPKRAN